MKNNNNKIQLSKQLTRIQLKTLSIQLAKSDFYNKLLLIINKQIKNYPNTKINDKMTSSLNQNISYNFSKNSSPYYNNYIKEFNNNNIYKYAFINNSSRIGVINFVVKFLTSFFNSISCIIARPQFINKHDKLIIRIPFYKNNIQKDSLFTNKNSNYIFNLIKNNSSDYNNIINNNLINSNNLTKNVWIKWLKDYLNLNINNLNKEDYNNKLITLNTINNFIKNDKIIDNKLLNDNLSKPAKIKSSRNKWSNILNNKNISNKNNKLLMKIAKTNSLDYLNKIRLNNLKQSSNKLLILKLIKNLNNLNEKSKEILGRGILLQPVSKIILDKISGGLYDSKGDINFLDEYKLISNKLLTTNLLNTKSLNIFKSYSKEIKSLNKISNNKLIINLKLVRNINHKLNSLKSQFLIKNDESINFILNSIIEQLNPYVSIKTQPNNNIVRLLILNRQLSLINKLGLSLLTIKKNNNKLPLLEVDSKKLIYNIKILKLIIKNNIISNKTLNKSSDKITLLNLIKTNDNLVNKIKETFLAYKYYNSKIKNNDNILKNNITKFKWLGVLLSKIFKKNVNIELIRLWNIGLEPNILSTIISKNSVTDKSSTIFKKLWRKIVINKANTLKINKQNSILNSSNLAYNKIINLNLNNYTTSNGDIKIGLPFNNSSSISSNEITLLNKSESNLKLNQIYDFINDPSLLNTNPIALAKPVGLSIKIAGRLAKERIQPKKTTKSILVGSTKREKGSVVDSYKFTSKNKRGAFTINVKLSSTRC